MGFRFLDQYSLLHFATGITAYFWGVPLVYYALIHTIFELSENTNLGIHFINTYLPFWPGKKLHPDAVINSIGDVLSGIVGLIFARYVDDYGKKQGWYR